ncbi:MAG: Uma2 family endonuclease [Cyanothece sp. SIO1E1]|nr:Uma2 family endonuclease [Cyanothece sp. SIO1E1]
MVPALKQIQSTPEVIYPDPDGSPMAESDPARDYLIYGVKALELYFQDQDDVYVSGNLEIFYKQGVSDAKVAPDVFVVLGVAKKKRRSYKIWEEGGKAPSFVLEVTSKSTQENDEENKPKKYCLMGVSEYFQYDPTGDYLNPPLKGKRLSQGTYQPISTSCLPDGVLSLSSKVLGLDLQLIEGELRFYNPRTGKRLLSYEETEQARQATATELKQAQQRADAAEAALAKAEQEKQALIEQLRAAGIDPNQLQGE